MDVDRDVAWISGMVRQTGRRWRMDDSVRVAMFTVSGVVVDQVQAVEELAPGERAFGDMSSGTGTGRDRHGRAHFAGNDLRRNCCRRGRLIKLLGSTELASRFAQKWPGLFSCQAEWVEIRVVAQAWAGWLRAWPGASLPVQRQRCRADARG